MAQQKTKRVIPPKQKSNKHFIITGNDTGHPIICTDETKDETVELEHIPIEVLAFLNIWIHRLIDFNGGHGEITIKIKDGLFSNASATETFRFINDTHGDSIP